MSRRKRRRRWKGPRRDPLFQCGSCRREGVASPHRLCRECSAKIPALLPDVPPPRLPSTPLPSFAQRYIAVTTVLFAGAVACAFGGALAFAALPPAFGFLGVLAAGITFAIDQGFFDPDAPVIDDGSDPYEVTLTRVTPHRVDGVPGLLVWTGFRCDPPQYWRRAVQRVGLTAGDDAHGTRTSHVRSEDLERPFGRFALSTFLPFGDVPLVDLAGDEFRMLLSVSVEVDGELVALWTQRLRDRIPRPRVAEDGGEEYPGRRSDAESIRFLPGPVVTTPAAPAPEGPVCQVCGDLAGAGCVPCSRCDIPQHPACWTYVGRCAVFGCGGRPAR